MTSEQLAAVKSGFVILIIFIILHVAFMAVSPDVSMSHPGIFGTVLVAGTLSSFAKVL
jgi:hypothetical protein